ncbi:helix-turn-helix domain-containing protein [Acidobacteriota bacterium]
MRILKIGKKKIKQYTVTDLMEILDISKVTSLKLLKSGQLRSIRIGRQYWINEDDLVEFLLGDRDRLAKNYDNEDVLKTKVRNPLFRFILKRLMK